MNAEMLGKKEFSDSVVTVDFIRVNQLINGQDFLMNGIWWTVHSISKGRLYYYNKHAQTKRRAESLGAKSQMFVQVAK